MLPFEFLEAVYSVTGGGITGNIVATRLLHSMMELGVGIQSETQEAQTFLRFLRLQDKRQLSHILSILRREYNEELFVDICKDKALSEYVELLEPLRHDTLVVYQPLALPDIYRWAAEKRVVLEGLDCIASWKCTVYHTRLYVEYVNIFSTDGYLENFTHPSPVTSIYDKVVLYGAFSKKDLQFIDKTAYVKDLIAAGGF